MIKKTVPKGKRLFQLAWLLSIPISLWFVPWPIVTAWIQPLPETVQEQVDQAEEYGFDGIIVYVDQLNGEPKTFTSGWHNRDKQIATKPDALFKIASIGKLFHAVSITKMASSGMLDIDESLAHYFPELADRIEYADQITIRMLVQHKSGIPNFTNTPNFWMTEFENKSEVLELILDQPANFNPGTDYEYCNTNYLLLSMLIENLTGKPEFEYMKQEILIPLGLQHIYGSVNDLALDDLMSGYYVGIEEDIKTTDYGSMISNAADLAVFVRALNTGGLLNNEETILYNEIYELEHTGLIPGYQSFVSYHADLDAVIVQFVNTTNFDGYEWNLAEVMLGRVTDILKDQALN